MSRDDTARWLAALQARFGAALRTPLDPSSGHLREDLARYPQQACDDLLPGPRLPAAERLAVYNRQYWMRLLKLLQAELPLTARLLGPWRFNQIAMRFVTAQPPRGHDLARVADGFDDFLARELAEKRPETPGPALPAAALLEAARLDGAYRRVFFAPEPAPFALGCSADELPRVRLRFSGAYARLSLRWPLIALRQQLLGTKGERPVPLPAQLAEAQHFALVRTERGVVHLPLQPQQARMLELLESHPVGEALARLQAECPEGQRTALPARAQGWLAEGVAHGFFSGAPQPPAPLQSMVQP